MKRLSGFISSLKEVYLGNLTSEDETEPFDQYEVLPYSNQQKPVKEKKHKDKDHHKDGKEKDKQKHIGKKLNDAFERQMEKIEKKLLKKKEKDEEMTIKYSQWCAVIEKKTKSLIESIHHYNKMLESNSSSSSSSSSQQATTIFGPGNNPSHPMTTVAKQIVAICEDLIGYLEMNESHIIFSSGTHNNTAIYATNTPVTAVRALPPDEFDSLSGNNLKNFRYIRELFTELWCLVLEPHNTTQHGINNLLPSSKDKEHSTRESVTNEEEHPKEKKGRVRVSTSANIPVASSAPIATSKPRSASTNANTTQPKSKSKAITFLEKLSKTDSFFSDTDVAIVYKLLTVVMRRREFDCKHLQLNTQNIPTCPESDLQCFRKYRTLLYATQAYITRKIVKSMGCHSFYKRFQLNVFCARVLAITFFRIPEIGEQIMQAITMDPVQATKLAETLAKIDRVSNKDLALIKLNEFVTISEPTQPQEDANNNNNEKQDTEDSKEDKRGSLERSIDNDPLRGSDPLQSPAEEYDNHLADFKLKIAKSNFPAIFGWKHFHEALSDSQSFVPSATPISFSESPDEAPTMYTIGSRLPKKRDAPLIIYNQDNSVKVIEANSKSQSQTPPQIRRSYEPNAERKQQNSAQRTIDKYDLSVNPNLEKPTTEENSTTSQTSQPSQPAQESTSTAAPSDTPATESTTSSDPLTAAANSNPPEPAPTSEEPSTETTTSPVPESPKTPRKQKHSNRKNNENGVSSQNNNNTTDQEKKPETWILILRNNDAFFYFFLKEFVFYVYGVVTANNKLPNASHFDWTFVDGYTIFARHLVFHLLQNDSWSRPLLDASCALLLAQPSLINLYMKILFQRTNALHIPSVMDTLATLEIWFKHFISHKTHLPANFDCSYFASCLQILFNFDHHQIVNRVISVLYNNSDAFSGTARKGLFLDFLVKKNFFNLFLHWDDNIRNAFHQLLVFKACRVRRSLLAAEGIHVDELASADANVSKLTINNHVPVIIRDYMGNEIITEPPTHTQSAPSSPAPQPASTENSDIGNLETVEARPRRDSRPVNVRVNSFIQKKDLAKSIELEAELSDPQQNQERENFLDTVVFAKIEAFVRIIQEQLRDKTIHAFDKELEVYVPRALSEYKLYLSRYYAWERSGETDPPKLVPMHLLNVMRDD